MEKETFIMRKKYQQQIAMLTIQQKADLLDAVFSYQASGSLPEDLDPLVKMLLSIMIDERKSDDEKYIEICEKRREYGKLGGAPKGNSNAVKNWEKQAKQPKQPKGSKNNQNKPINDSDKGYMIYDKGYMIDDNENNNKEKIIKKKFLEFVLLSEDEHQKLVNQFGERQANELIDRLNNYIGSTGKKYKSHYFTILNRARKEQPTTKTNVEREMQIQRHREKILEQIDSFTSQTKQNEETGSETGGYNRRENIGFSEIPG